MTKQLEQKMDAAKHSIRAVYVDESSSPIDKLEAINRIYELLESSRDVIEAEVPDE